MKKLTLVLEAVSHPVRRAILARLRKKMARVTEVAAPFSMSLNAVSKHLKVLEAAGLIRRQKKGREHWLEFVGAPLKAVAIWVHTYEEQWNAQLDQLELHFETKRRKNHEQKDAQDTGPRVQAHDSRRAQGGF